MSRTVCNRGHELIGHNRYAYIDQRGCERVHCRICLSDNQRNHRHRREAERVAASSLDGEVWLPVPAWEGIYEVSDHGRLRRLSRSRAGRAGYFIRGSRHSAGYIEARLLQGARSERVYVHRLVAAAFLGPCPPGYHVNHIDGDKTNNTLGNLEYCSPSQNLVHAYRIGLHRAKHSAEVVAAIRQRYQPKVVTLRMLADEFGIPIGTVDQIIRRRTWQHVEIPPCPTD